MIDPDFERVRAAAQDSRIWRVTARFVERAAAACLESAVLTRVCDEWDAFSRLPAHDRLRSCAVGVAWGAVLHGVARASLPEYAVSGLPLWWNAAAASVAVVVAMAPRAFASAWHESAAARHWRSRNQAKAE